MKPKHKGQQKERSVFEIVHEDGVMRSKEILHIVQQLCRILENPNAAENGCIHPQTIIVNANGAVRLSAQALPLSAREAYIPPEQDQFDGSTSASVLYALGMTMLFMATGHEKKADLDAFVEDSSLRTLITRCTAFDPQMRFARLRDFSLSIKRGRRGVRKALPILLSAVCVCAAGFAIFQLYRSGEAYGEAAGKESGYADGYTYGYEKGFADAPGIGIDGASFAPDVGNLSGNLAAQNGAFAARSQEEVFFLHEGGIYRMNPYTQSAQALVADANVHSLSYYDGWLYYCTDEKVLRVNPTTLAEEVFCDSRTGFLYIADGAFFLLDTADTGYLYRINASAGTLTQLNGMTQYHCLNIVDGKLYFIDVEKGNNLYRCDFDGSNLRLINSGSCQGFCIYNGKIYAYTASFEKGSLNYSASSLICMDLDGGNIESFTNIPAYYPNVTDGGIFYIAGANRTLEWMAHNGRTRYTVLPTSTRSFNIAGRWIFYLNEEEDGALWRVRIDGSGNTKVAMR